MIVSTALTRLRGRGRGIISAACGAGTVQVLPVMHGEAVLGTLLPAALGARRSTIPGPMAEVPAAEIGPSLLALVQGLWIRGLYPGCGSAFPVEDPPHLHRHCAPSCIWIVTGQVLLQCLCDVPLPGPADLGRLYPLQLSQGQGGYLRHLEFPNAVC